ELLSSRIRAESVAVREPAGQYERVEIVWRDGICREIDQLGMALRACQDPECRRDEFRLGSGLCDGLPGTRQFAILESIRGEKCDPCSVQRCHVRVLPCRERAAHATLVLPSSSLTLPLLSRPLQGVARNDSTWYGRER